MPSTYVPIQLGIDDRFKDDVLYIETPSIRQSDIVYCYWELKSLRSLEEDFIYEALPDGCIDIVFKSGSSDSGIVMTPAGKTEQINLGKSFHYIGIRLNIGYWKYAARVVDKQVPLRDFIALKNARIPSSLQNKYSIDRIDIFVDLLIAAGCINKNPLSAVLQARSDELRSVEDMIQISGYGRRQLQRIVKDETGFLPKQLLDIIRFQSVLSRRDDGWRYSDEAHINRDFKRRTGLTPRAFRAKFSRIMSEIFKTRKH